MTAASIVGSTIDGTAAVPRTSWTICLKFMVPPLVQSYNLPAAIRRSGSMAHSGGGDIVGKVEVERDHPLCQRAMSSLRDEHARQPATLVCWLGDHRQFMTVAVMQLASNTGGDLAHVIPGDKNVAVERLEPGRGTGIVVRDPFANLRQLSRRSDHRHVDRLTLRPRFPSANATVMIGSGAASTAPAAPAGRVVGILGLSGSDHFAFSHAISIPLASMPAGCPYLTCGTRG